MNEVANPYARCLGQVRPADLNNTLLYRSPIQKVGIITAVVIANTSGAGATYRLFHDAGGVTYDESTALAWDKNVATQSFELIEFLLAMNQSVVNWGISRGALAVRTSVASALTFTAYGYELLYI